MLIVNAVIALKHQPAPRLLPTPNISPICLADTAGNGRASSPSARAVDSTGPKATLGEARPDLTGVGATGKRAVGVQNGVAGLNKVGVTRLPMFFFLISFFDDRDEGRPGGSFLVLTAPFPRVLTASKDSGHLSRHRF
jgi:hypothetical protein